MQPDEPVWRVSVVNTTPDAAQREGGRDKSAGLTSETRRSTVGCGRTTTVAAEAHGEALEGMEEKEHSEARDLSQQARPRTRKPTVDHAFRRWPVRYC